MSSTPRPIYQKIKNNNYTKYAGGIDRSKITIPAIAVLSDYDGDPSAWVYKPETQTVHQRKVKTGELSGADSIKILAGLEGGEQIAVTAVNSLQEGMKVRSLSDMEGGKK